MVDHKIKAEKWLESAEQDRKVAIDMFNSKNYHWTLFVWHLILEKTIKAKIEKGSNEPLWTHNLISLCKDADIDINSEEKMQLAEINTFNVGARYDIEKYRFYKKATLTYTKIWIKICETLYQKLLKEYEK